jgi:uncharacterized membrane protein YdbT with pleckstrin-like domain
VRIANLLSSRDIATSSVHRYLLPNEEASIAVRKHPALLLRVGAEIVIATMAAAVLSFLINNDGVTLVTWAAWLFVFGRMSWKFIDWHSGYFVVTSRRVLMVTGLLNISVLMMPIAKVVDITVERPVLGRVFGYGTITLESPGQQQALQKVTYMPEPEELYVEISSMVFPSKDSSPD